MVFLDGWFSWLSGSSTVQINPVYLGYAVAQPLNSRYLGIRGTCTSDRSELRNGTLSPPILPPRGPPAARYHPREGGGGTVLYLGIAHAKVVAFDPRYRVRSDLYTSVRCKPLSCAGWAKSEEGNGIDPR